METTKKKRKAKGTSSTRDRILRKYQEIVLLTGERPASVYRFCLDLELPEDDFYSYFGSFQGVERVIWADFADRTIKRLRNDKPFQEFNSQERVLAFYYTLMEEFRAGRSFIVHQLNHHNKLDIIPDFIKDFKRIFEGFLAEILAGGKNRGEIPKRPYLDERYPKLFWAHFVLLLLYWKDDDSASFEQTDAYIEKSVRLAFDLIGKGVIDSAIDFAKFVYQSKVR